MNFCRVWCSGETNRNQVEMEETDSEFVVVDDPELFQKKKAAIRLAGPAKLQVYIWNFVHLSSLSVRVFLFVNFIS